MIIEDEPGKVESFLNALADGETTADACKIVNISYTSGLRILRDPETRARLSQMQSDKLRPAYSLLVTEMRNSVQRLAQLRDDPLVHSSTRVKAAVSLCELGLRLHEAIEVLPRLLALEAAVQNHATN